MLFNEAPFLDRFAFARKAGFGFIEIFFHTLASCMMFILRSLAGVESYFSRQPRSLMMFYVAYRTAKGLNILMIDDSEEDAFFVKRALDKSAVPYMFHAVVDGSLAIAYLRAQGDYSDREKFPFPNLLLCDLKMSGMDGFDMLRWLRDHPDCKVIPTVIFSSSSLESDIHQSYVLGANAYLEKPTSSDELAVTIQRLYEFWSRCQVPLPPPGERCS